jgi:hypothetical protein
MAKFKVKSPDGSFTSVEAVSPEEAISIVKSSQEQPSLADRLQRKVDEASIKGERMGGGLFSSIAASLAKPAISALGTTQRAVEATNMAGRKAEELSRQGLEQIVNEPIAKAAERFGESKLPIPTPFGIIPIPTKYPIAAAGSLAKVGTEFSSSMINPVNLAITYLAPLGIKGIARIEKGVAQKIVSSPAWNDFTAWVAKSVPESVKGSAESFLRYVTTNYKIPPAFVAAKNELPYNQYQAAKEQIGKLGALEKATPEQAADITAVLEGKKILPPEKKPVQLNLFNKNVIADDIVDSRNAPIMEEKGLENLPSLQELSTQLSQKSPTKLEAYVQGYTKGGISPNTKTPYSGTPLYGVRGGTPQEYKRLFNDPSPGSVTEEQLKRAGLKIPQSQEPLLLFQPKKGIELEWTSKDKTELRKMGVDVDAIEPNLPKLWKESGTPTEPIKTAIPREEKGFQLVAGTLTSEQAKATKFAQTSFVELGKQLVDLGMLSEDTYLANLRKYSPRLYKQYETDLQTKGIFGTETPTRVNVERFKQRKVDDPTVLQGLTQLKGAYPTEKGLAQLSAAVEKGKFLKSIADNPKFASPNPIEGWTQLPDVKGLGPLQDMYVEPNVAYNLRSTFKELPTWAKVIKKVNTAWKLGKTTFNPAVQLNNAMFNTVLADWSGADFATQARLAPLVLKDITNKAGIYQDLMKGGITDPSEMSQTVVMHLRSLLGETPEGYTGMVQKILSSPTNTYQAAEILNKGIIYKAALERGMSPVEALTHAKKWGIDYGEVSPLIQDIRSYAIPFITFPSKLIPLAAETLVKNPMAIYKYKLLTDAIEQTAINEGVVTPDKVNRIHREEKGFPVVLPFKGKNGEPYVWNISRIMPIDAAQSAIHFGGPPAIAAQAAMNVKRFDTMEPQPIAKATETPLEKTLAYTNFLGQAATPSLMPGVYDIRSPFKGGTAYARIKKAEKGEINPATGEPYNVKEALLGMVGIDIAAKSGELTEGLRLKQAKQLIEKKQQVIRKDIGFKNLSEEEINFLLNQLDSKIEELLKESSSVREKLDIFTGRKFRPKAGK